MGKTSERVLGRKRRQRSLRRKIQGSSEQPRVTVFRSLKHTYAQLIDDTDGKVLATVSSKVVAEGSSKSVESAKAVGKRIAEIAKENNIEKAVFDRNGYLYHGRVAAVAEGAREGGLGF